MHVPANENQGHDGVTSPQAASATHGTVLAGGTVAVMMPGLPCI